MTRARVAAGLSALLLAIVPAASAKELTQEEQDYLAALQAALPGPLMNNPLESPLTTYGEGFSAKMVRDKTVPGGAAYRVSIKQAHPNAWDVSTVGTLTGGISAGEGVSVTFWARAEKTDKSGAGHLTVRLQEATAPYTAVVESQLDISKDWQLYEVKGVSPLTLAAQDMTLAFNFADRKQTLDFGEYFIVNLDAE
ncbi:MAG: hypothetical protein R3C13_06420 [Hyphomonas sp.]|uniref:hypothetical protein n=1 Tax=Hyphomonas sp. TaxID=87 RepID=UPI00352751D8